MMLKAWKTANQSFPFIDSHAMNYNVRDNSDWEFTLKPRLRERLRYSKNIVFILSTFTKSSRALREEIDYGINQQGLPITVIYPEYSTKESLLLNGNLRQEVQNLWGKLPIFRDGLTKVPTLHTPWRQQLIKESLQNKSFTLAQKVEPGIFFYK